jgi:hypothetical protein
MASINGATQIRAGVMRPEIIVPEINQETSEIDLSVTVDEEKFSGIMNIGSRVRIIRRPYFGSIGNVVKMPIKLEIIETGCNVRVVEIQLDDNRTVTIPWANVELLDDRLSA